MDITKSFKHLLTLIIYFSVLVFFFTINTAIYFINEILNLIKTIKRIIDEKIILFREGRVFKKR